MHCIVLCCSAGIDMFGSLKRSKFEKGVGGMMIWRWRAKENKNKSGYWKSKLRIKESNEGDRPFFLGFFLFSDRVPFTPG